MSSRSFIMDASQRVDRIPQLDEKQFVLWKHRMKHFLVIHNVAFWRSITDGPYVPMTVPADNGNVAVPKELSEYTDEDYERTNVHRKAHALLTMALPDKILRGFNHSKSAKELWDDLCAMFEGPSDVLNLKTELLVQQYEEFVYIDGESLDQQFMRFASLVSVLKTYGIIYSEERLVYKFMRSLPRYWRMYTIVIRGSNDLAKMTLDQLHDKLKIYESDVNEAIKISQRGRQAR